MTATLKQGNQALSLIQQHTNSASFQKLLASGLFTDLLQGDVDLVDRNQFRELLGLKPLQDVEHSRNYGNPLERYPWLGRKFCFAGIDLEIVDEVSRIGTGKSRLSRSATKKLFILSQRAVSREELAIHAREISEVHNRRKVEVLDQHGQTIGSLSRTGMLEAVGKWDLSNWNFNFDDARFLTLDAEFTVHLYVITRTRD